MVGMDFGGVRAGPLCRPTLWDLQCRKGTWTGRGIHSSSEICSLPVGIRPSQPAGNPSGYRWEHPGPLHATMCYPPAYAGRFACGEHPAEPAGSDHASIWRLDIMQHIFRHPRVRRVRVLQGQFGADSPKPTDFVIHGPSDPQAVFRRLAKKCNRGTTIGLTADGRGFRTAKLKEYPGPLCRALTAVYSTWLEETGMIADDQPKDSIPPEVVLTLANFVQGLDQCAEHLGPDYNVAACAR